MPVFDYEDGEFLHIVSGHMAVDFDGNPMIRLSDNTVMDMDSGDIHMISSWPSGEGGD